LEELVVESLDDCCFGGWLVHREEEMEMVPLERGIHDLGWFQSPGSSYAVILYMAAECDTLLKDYEHLPTKFRINYYPQLKIAVFQLPTVWWQRYPYSPALATWGIWLRLSRHLYAHAEDPCCFGTSPNPITNHNQTQATGREAWGLMLNQRNILFTP